MAKRRGNKEGCVVQRSKNSWRCQVSIGGTRFSHTAPTRKECQEWLKKITSEAEMGLDYKGAQQTFEEFLETWLANIRTSVRPVTFYQYQMTCKRYILPTLGQIKLNQVKPGLIQKLYAEKLQSGLGARTVEIIHSVLHRAFVQAVKLEILGRNPVDATTPPKVEEKEMRFFDESQVSLFLLAARGDKNEIVYHLAIATGMRQSELLGLKWSDLDWQKKTITIQRQLKRLFRGEGYFSPPKTRNGRRSVMLGDVTLAKLREQWERLKVLRQMAGSLWQENDLIFPSSIGTPKNQSNLYREFKELIRQSGLPDIRFHDLRHTAATLLLNHGVPPIVVSRRLGHYKVSMTLDIYGHLMPEIQDTAAKLIDELITPVEIKLHHNCTIDQVSVKRPV